MSFKEDRNFPLRKNNFESEFDISLFLVVDDEEIQFENKTKAEEKVIAEITEIAKIPENSDINNNENHEITKPSNKKVHKLLNMKAIIFIFLLGFATGICTANFFNKHKKSSQLPNENTSSETINENFTETITKTTTETTFESKVVTTATKSKNNNLIPYISSYKYMITPENYSNNKNVTKPKTSDDVLLLQDAIDWCLGNTDKKEQYVSLENNNSIFTDNMSKYEIFQPNNSSILLLHESESTGFLKIQSHDIQESEDNLQETLSIGSVTYQLEYRYNSETRGIQYSINLKNKENGIAYFEKINDSDDTYFMTTFIYNEEKYNFYLISDGFIYNVDYVFI